MALKSIIRKTEKGDYRVGFVDHNYFHYTKSMKIARRLIKLINQRAKIDRQIDRLERLN